MAKKKTPYYARSIQIPGPGATVEGQIRYSDRSQSGSLTIESQQAEIVRFCERMQWKVLSWSIEEDISGGPETIEERSLWQKHIARIGKEVDCSVSLDLSRWSRDPVAPWLALRLIRDQGGYWCTADEQHSLDRIESDIGAQVTFAIGNITNSNYLRQISKRVVMGISTRARQGLHNGPVSFGYARAPIPPPPPGYNLMTYKVNQRLPIIPDETWNESAEMTAFQALQKIGEMRGEGFSFEQISHWLNKHGFLTGTRNPGNLGAEKKQQFVSKYGPAGGRPFIPEGVQRLLHSRLPREFVSEDGIPSEHGTVYDPISQKPLQGLHIAAWHAELCERIDAVNREHQDYNNLGRKTYSERRRSGQYEGAVYSYSGLLLCAECGAAVNGYRPGIYMDMSYASSQECRSGRSARVRDLMLDIDIELLLGQALTRSTQEQVKHKAGEFAQTHQNAQQESPQVLARRAELDAERKRIVSMFAKGDITEQEKDELLKPIKEELQVLRPRPIKLPQLKADDIVSASERWATLAKLWRYMTASQRGEMLGLMFESRGIAIDMEGKRIARILPKPEYMPLCQLALQASEKSVGWFDMPISDFQQRELLIAELATLRGIALRRKKDGTVAKGSRYIHPDVIEQMRQLRATGESFAAIARACKVDVKTVYRYVVVTKNGTHSVDRRRHGRYKQNNT